MIVKVRKNSIKYEDINKGLTLEEYIDWCKEYNPKNIVNIKSSQDCTKEEILNYSYFLNKEHKKNMNNNYYKDDNVKMFACYDCKYNKEMTKFYSRDTGKIKYCISCMKEMISFIVKWNTHISNLPCYKNKLMEE